MFYKCQTCGESVSTNMKFCWKCGAPVEQKASEPIVTPVTQATGSTLQLDCNACKTTSSMMSTRIARFSNIVRVIGCILLVPSFLGIAFAGLMLLSTLMATSQMPTGHSDAENAGRAIGFGIGFVFSIVVGVISLVGGLVGWLLLLNRNVWKCMRCGFVLDRA